ncbi:MAG TPA: hypothetical protein DCP11_07945 [Microbacteriaceae bacterium]|jgi:hypothetical protein|nr:hypothetical protein [Microbacteriaceae bacterium]
MKRFALLTTLVTAVLTLVLPFVGGGGPSLGAAVSSANAAETGVPMFASPAIATVTAVAPIVPASTKVLESRQAQTVAYLKTDTEHLAQKPVPIPVVVAPPAPTAASGSHRSSASAASGTAERRAAAAASGASCPGSAGGGGSAPGRTSAGGVAGTTSGDIQSFSAAYNSIRAANCLQSIPAGNFRYDACMEQRLFWMAEDPSTDPASAWGHLGSVRSDGVPSVGCDGNLAGGTGNSGATVAQKWWDSAPHRLSLYKPSYTGSTGGVCIYFAMTHGGIPNEPYSFTRAAARWGGC